LCVRSLRALLQLAREDEKMALEGGHRFMKYLLIIFNFIFLLAGLTLIIIGSVAAAKLSPYSSVAGVHFNGVGIFIIVIGFVVFLISLFGCLGAYKENYCLLITFVILMIVSLLALIAAIITAFVMRNQVTHLMEQGLKSTIPDYNKKNNDVITKLWDELQLENKCCGSNSSVDWKFNEALNKTNSVPDSCCKSSHLNCGNQQLIGNKTEIYTEGCSVKFSDPIFKNIVAVGGAAAAIAILQFIGIIFGCCLASALRKEYQTV
jgi:CD63 antigen